MNTKDLRDMIMNEIQDLRDGKTTVAKSATMARHVTNLVSTKKLELQTARFKLETKGTIEAVEI